MLEPPADLADQTLLASLRTGYGLAATRLTFLPLGHDPWAWVYRAWTADGASYFLKVRRTVTNQAGLVIPRYLQDHGVARVVAPLPTVTGTLWTTAGRYALIVYPFVEGGTGMMRGMSDQQWIAYGTVLRQIHDTVPSSDVARLMRRETFRPDGADQVRRIDADLTTRTLDGPELRVRAAIWLERRETILTVLARAEELGRRLEEIGPPLLLCHADIHTNNVLVDDVDHGIWVADWDEAMLAPRERDLMFVIRGITVGYVSPRQQALFFKGYGPVAVDPLGLACYRYAWAISDIGSYGEQIFYRPDLGPATRNDSIERLLSIFEPGHIVSIALDSEIDLS